MIRNFSSSSSLDILPVDDAVHHSPRSDVDLCHGVDVVHGDDSVMIHKESSSLITTHSLQT